MKLPIDIVLHMCYSIPMNREKHLTFRINHYDHQNYVKHAKKRKQSLSEWIRQALAKVFKKENK